MIKIEKTQTSGWSNALEGMRNPKESYDRADSEFSRYVVPGTADIAGEFWDIGPNDHALAMRLAKAGNEHGKFLRQIFVSCRITAPVYWLRELDTYKIGTTLNSTSLMHKGTDRHYTVERFSADDLYGWDSGDTIRTVIDALNEMVDVYNETKDNYTFRALRQLMPMGYNYTGTWSANYAVLRNIYHQRKAHRLSEWREFCGWCASLPYSEFIVEE